MLKGWFGLFEVWLYEVLIHSQWTVRPQFGKADRRPYAETEVFISTYALFKVTKLQ